MKSQARPGPSERAKLDRAAAEISMLRRQEAKAREAFEAAQAALNNRWEELTGISEDHRFSASPEMRARATYLNDAVWKFEGTGATACLHEGRIVIVPWKKIR